MELVTTASAKHMVSQAQMNQILSLAEHTEITNEVLLSKVPIILSKNPKELLKEENKMIPSLI